MKRSEMIFNIANYLCKEEYGEETVDTMRSSIESRLMRQATEIIDRIKEAGMLPPFISSDAPDPDDLTMTFGWEPEDE